MDWFTDRHTFLLAVLVYGWSTVYSVFLWRRGFRRDDRINTCLLLLGFGLHTVAMVQRGFSFQACPVNNLYEATTFLAWALALASLVVGQLPRLRFVGAFAAPLLFAIGVFALMPSLDPPRGPQPQFTGWLVSLHAAMILLAYGAFGLGAVSGLMYLSQQHDLKFKKLRAVFSLLPPIERLEIVTTRLVIVGFLFLTVGLLAGGRLPRPEGVSFLSDTKVKWSALLWLFYCALLIGRGFFHIAGKRFAVCVLGAFVFLFLTFWGTNLLSTLHHP